MTDAKVNIERELELIDGMIEVQLHHAEQCDHIANRTMAERQKGWDMERVALLRKMRAALAAQPADCDDCAEHASLKDRYGQLLAKNVKQAERVRVLREALADAIVCVQDWSAYVAPYYLERRDLYGDVKRLRAALEKTK